MSRKELLDPREIKDHVLRTRWKIAGIEVTCCPTRISLSTSIISSGDEGGGGGGV